MKLYFDSNVFMAYVLRDFGKSTDYMEGAFEDIAILCEEKNHGIILSDLFFKEVGVKTYSSKSEILNILKNLTKARVTELQITAVDKIESKSIERKTGLHYPDSLHISLAIRSKCDYIITWDKGFQKVSKLIKCATPREFI